MRHLIMTMTVVTIFAFGMGASMAQTRQDPGTIKVSPPAQPSPMQMQTQPATPPNLNTSKNPYENKRYMETPAVPPKK